MSDHIAIVITAWATLAAAVAAFWAVYNAHQQGAITTAYQLITQFDEHWNSEPMRAKRQNVAQLLLPLQPLPESAEPDDIIDFFETIALFVNDNVIPLKLAWHFYSYWLIRYWFAAGPRINHLRSLDPTIWEDLAAFMPKLLNYHARRRHRTVAEITPTTDELRKFLREESIP